MGAIARNIANKITTSGVFTSGAIANSSVTGITVLANASDGITFISSQTASNSASLSFTSGLDSTYKAYKFVYVDVRPKSNLIQFQFNLSTDSGSNYNVTKTTTYFVANNAEDDSSTALEYAGSQDLAQGTGFQCLSNNTGDSAINSVSGSLTLFNPSSTTYVKHFIGTSNRRTTTSSSYAENGFVAGYGNTTSAINAIRFQMSSGNMDGKIYMYGIK
jgi:hypothetical protein